MKTVYLGHEISAQTAPHCPLMVQVPGKCSAALPWTGITLVAFSIHSVAASICGSLKETLRFDNSLSCKKKVFPNKNKVERAMMEELLQFLSQFKGFV